MEKIQIKNMEEPDEIRSLPKTRIEVVKHGEHTIMRTTFDPGWKWSECVKPTVGTSSCQAPHLLYAVSGRMMVKMDDGTQTEIGAGQTALIPPGHDAWVLGNEPCVAVDFTAGTTYGKK